jgi:hypothetical protein
MPEPSREHTLNIDSALILNAKEGAQLLHEALGEHDGDADDAEAWDEEE